MYKFMFVNGTTEDVPKSLYRSFFIANRERIYGVVAIGGAK